MKLILIAIGVIPILYSMSYVIISSDSKIVGEEIPGGKVYWYYSSDRVVYMDMREYGFGFSYNTLGLIYWPAIMIDRALVRKTYVTVKPTIKTR